MEDGKWKMEDGRWKMENGKVKMENGRVNYRIAKKYFKISGIMNKKDKSAGIPLICVIGVLSF